VLLWIVVDGPLTVCVMYSMSLCAGLGEVLRR
jgi:hypothetical protein